MAVAGSRIGASDGRIERRRRLGGLLNFYCRMAGQVLAPYVLGISRSRL
jgi:hypothetical protein